MTHPAERTATMHIPKWQPPERSDPYSLAQKRLDHACERFNEAHDRLASAKLIGDTPEIDRLEWALNNVLGPNVDDAFADRDQLFTPEIRKRKARDRRAQNAHNRRWMRQLDPGE